MELGWETSSIRRWYRRLNLYFLITYKLIFLGGFNIHLDEKNNSNSMVFCDILTSFNLVQHVGEATHESGHLLDLVITRPIYFVSNVSYQGY